MTPTPWLTDQEATTYLKMEGKTPEKVLRRWCKQGRLEFARLGTRYRFKQEWLDSFMMLGGSEGQRRKAFKVVL